MDLSQQLGKYQFARDADGAVTTSELGTLMRSLGKMPSEADVVEMITQAGDNELSNLLNTPCHKPCIQCHLQVDASGEGSFNCQAQPKLLQGVSNFSPIFAHGPLPPSDGGGVPFSFPKNTIFGP